MDETNHSTNPQIRHETTDVNAWAVGKFAIGLVIVVTISIVLLFMLLRFFQGREATAEAPTVEPTKVFPEPQLQKTPILDLRAYRAEEDKLLTGYGWVDPQKGLVRIPINLAIDVLAKRGLPSRPVTAAPATTAAGAVLPTESTHEAAHEESKK